MDLVFTVGAYDVLAMAMRSFRIELDDDLVRGGNDLLLLGDRCYRGADGLTGGTQSMAHFPKPAEG